MDFSVINDFPNQPSPGSKVVTVILAENGSLYEYPYIKFVSPIGLKKANFFIEFVEKEYGISKSNQFILRSDDGKQLETAVTLEDYFKKDTTVYVYVIKGEANENLQDDFEIIGGLGLEKKWSESVLQFLPAIYENQLGRDVRDLLEPQTVDSYNELMALFCDIKSELNSIKDGTIKLMRQKNAEEVAKKNLFTYYNERKRKFDEILGVRESKIELFQGYINNFETYITRLSKQEIDPQLGEEDKKYLSDYFDVEKLRKSKTNYEKNQIKIKQKAQEIREDIQQYEDHLQKIEICVKDNSQEIHGLLGEQENLFADIQSINLQGFKQLVEDKKGAPTQKDLSDFIRRENESSAPKLKDISQELRVIKDKLEDQLRENAQKLKNLISDIMNLRVIIKGKIYNKLKVFCSVVDKHAEQIFNLEIIEKFPQVYEQSLNEIKRRTGFKKDYLTVLNILESFANSENRLRQEFLEMYQTFLPKTFCPFLSKTFPQLNFDHIKRMIDQDLNTEMNDFVQHSSRASSEADTLRLLNNLNNNLETKDKRITELAESLQKLHEENEGLKDQMKHKVFNVSNFRRLLGATGFQEKVEEFFASNKTTLSDKVAQVEKRIDSLQTEKIASLNKMLAEYKNSFSLNSSLATDKLANFESLIKASEEKIAALESTVQESENVRQELLAKNEEVTAKLETASAENNNLRAQIVDLGEQKSKLEHESKALASEISRLEEELSQYRTNASKDNESKEKRVIELTKALENTQTELQRKQSSLDKSQEQIADLSKEITKLEEKLTSTKDLLKETSGLKEEAENKNMSLEIEKSDLRQDLDKISAKYYEKLEEFNQVKLSSEKAIQSYEALLQTFDSMKTHVEGGDAKTQEKQKVIDKLKEKINALEEKLKENDSQLAEAKQEIDSLRIKVVEQELQLENAKKEIEQKAADLQELRGVLEEEMNKSVLNQNPTNHLLGELGEKILGFYAKVLGDDNHKMNKEFDIGEALSEIEFTVMEKMVKIEELQAKDRVIAIKIPKQKEYLVLSTLSEFVLQLYKPEVEGLSDIIVGEIESISEQSYSAAFKNIFEVDSSVKIALKGVRPLSSIPFVKKI